METFFSGEEIVDMAVSIEENGYRFYKNAEKHAKTDEARLLFAFLAGEEANHKQIFLGLKGDVAEKQQGVPIDWDEVGQYIEAMVESSIFMGKDKNIVMAAGSESDAEAIEYAIKFERDTLLFFYQLRDLIKPGARDAVEEIIKEEKGHVKRLADMKKQM